MNGTLPEPASHTPWQRIAPIVTLLLLAPIFSEVLSGSTRITKMFVLLPEIGIWGCGALIIRCLVRRRQKDWISIWILGIALAIAEECVIQQTSLAPLIGTDPVLGYGRLWGVNWLYLTWALGFESIWVVVVPIQLVELIFPTRREEPWMGQPGLVIASIFFLLASFMAWYSWTQVFLPKFYPQSVYRVPSLAIGIALAVIAGLGTLALIRKSTRPQGSLQAAPRPWLVGLAAFVGGSLWFLMILLSYGLLPALPFVIPILASLGLAGLSFVLLKRWTTSLEWRDTHRLALVFGVLVATLVAGAIVMSVSQALPIDRIGQVLFNLIAILLLGRFAYRRQYLR